VNPFNYQGPIEPRDLIDRGAELDALQKAAADRVNVRLAAPRRYGKSSLIAAHLETMRSVGHRVVSVDFYRVATVADVAERVLSAYDQLPRDPARTLEGLMRRLGLSLGPAGVTVQVGARGARDPLGVEQARHVLLEVLDLPQKLAVADGALTVVAFDEFQDLLTADDRLDGLFRSVIQYHGRSAAYIYAGSRPSLLKEMFAAQERPFFGQARPLELPPLPADETIAQLETVLATHDLDAGPAVADIVEIAAGHPQRTMLLAHHLFNLLTDAGDPNQLTAAVLDLALEETNDVHQGTWNSLGRPERAVAVALADGLAPTGPNTARQHATPRGQLQRALARLLADQQVVVDGPRLVDPLFAEWLRRR